MVNDVLAHVLRDGEGNVLRSQALRDHLEQVSHRAAEFTARFDSDAWGRISGLWHDLGKYRPEFQERIRGKDIRAPHAGVGAVAAVEAFSQIGFPLAFVIAGHHAGLANREAREDGVSQSPLKERIDDDKPLLAELRDTIPPELLDQEAPVPPAWVGSALRDHDMKPVEFWTRFLFSALVDADWLDTELFMDPERANGRGGYADIGVLKTRLDMHLAKIGGRAKTDLGRARAEILGACRAAAAWEPGLFSLTAPTGGGKTLSSMAFALDHAVKHGKRRVIVVIPYTSIIEQNAQVYRDVFGAENVVEHHANVDIEVQEKEYGSGIARRNKLATENWDAPIIVTTTVQFFESLFANRPSRCRKLHNIAESVIIFDEVQTLPPEFLLSILDALRELSGNYGCSLVLSTATQPALHKRDSLEAGLEGVREILPEPQSLMWRLDRVEIEWPAANAPAVEWADLADEVAAHEQVLAVVNKRADARELAQAVAAHVPGETVRHLSALMCAKHRLDVIREVRAMLENDKPCRLISTQLIEAGVDLDFPAVYRAMAGLDSIVQAAGRCNREGELPGKGRVVVFKPTSSPPPGVPRQALDATTVMLGASGALDTLNPDTYQEFFRRLYFTAVEDKHNIQRERKELNFATVARDFKLIQDGHSHPVVVPYGEGAAPIEALRKAPDDYRLRRKLQPYIVQIYDNDFLPALRAGVIIEIAEGVDAHMLSAHHREKYDPAYGLVLEELDLSAENTIL